MESYTLKYLIRRCKFEEESENKLKRVENILSNLLLHSLELSKQTKAFTYSPDR